MTFPIFCHSVLIALDLTRVYQATDEVHTPCRPAVADRRRDEWRQFISPTWNEEQRTEQSQGLSHCAREFVKQQGLQKELAEHFCRGMIYVFLLHSHFLLMYILLLLRSMNGQKYYLYCSAHTVTY